MINTDIYTMITSRDQLDLLIMFSSSYKKHHMSNSGNIKCVVSSIDVATLPSIDGVEYVESLPSTYIFLSVDNFFMNRIYSLYSANREHNSIGSYFHDDESSDFKIVNGNDGKDIQNIAMNVNYSVSKYGDRHSYYHNLNRMKDVISINTKKFRVDDRTQINSLYTLLFPWEMYFDVMKNASGLSNEFVNAVMYNCHRFSHGIVYRHSGILDIL